MTAAGKSWRRGGAAILTMSAMLLAGCASDSGSADRDASSPTHGTELPSPSATSTPGVGLFDVNGHQLFAHCPSASGRTTVVFLHGAGGAGADWAPAAEHVDQREDVRTCWYDRFNVGMSGHDVARHDPAESVAELHGLLAAVDASPPYLLVGHSFGGLLALMYAGTYPDEVSGVVLADAVLPFETELDPPAIVEQVRAEVNGWETGLDAYRGYAEARRLQSSLPDVPVTYIFATQQDYPTEWQPGAYQRKLRAWVDRLPEGKLVLCDCTHNVPAERPDLVVEHVGAILDAER